jgi:hypothetical protein
MSTLYMALFPVSIEHSPVGVERLTAGLAHVEAVLLVSSLRRQQGGRVVDSAMSLA